MVIGTKSAVCIVKVQRNLGILGEGNAFRQIVLIYNEDRSLIGEVKLSKKQYKEVFDDDELKAYWEAEVQYKVRKDKFQMCISLRKENMLENTGIKKVCEIKKIDFIKKVKEQPW